MYLHSTPQTAQLQDTCFPSERRTYRRNPSGLVRPGTKTTQITPPAASQPARALTLSAFCTVGRVEQRGHGLTHIREVIPRVMAGLLAQLGSRR
jgi:hypothetical protein